MLEAADQARSGILVKCGRDVPQTGLLPQSFPRQRIRVEPCGAIPRSSRKCIYNLIGAIDFAMAITSRGVLHQTVCGDHNVLICPNRDDGCKCMQRLHSNSEEANQNEWSEQFRYSPRSAG